MSASIPQASHPAAALAAGRAATPARRSRRRRRPGPPTEADVARMLAEFCARGGRITVCPVAHAVPVNNGAGRDAAHWTT